MMTAQAISDFPTPLDLSGLQLANTMAYTNFLANVSTQGGIQLGSGVGSGAWMFGVHGTNLYAFNSPFYGVVDKSAWFWNGTSWVKALVTATAL